MKHYNANIPDVINSADYSSYNLKAYNIAVRYYFVISRAYYNGNGIQSQ